MYVSLLAVLSCMTLCVNGYVLNSDPQYTRWPGGKIPFYISPGEYTPAERTMLGQAMQKMNTDTGGCIQFEELTSPPAAGTMRYVAISKAGGITAPSPTCYSFPGMVAQQTGQGQGMSIQGGQSGCMNSPRHIMRMLASLTGLRSEHNKPNRDQFVTVSPQNVEPRVQPYVPLNVFDTNRVISNPSDFDYNSISMIDPLQFSGNGAAVIQSRTQVPLINSGSLSMKDCQAITWYYQCSATCQDPYGAGGVQSNTNGFNNVQGPLNQFGMPTNGQNMFNPNQQQQFPNGQSPFNQFGQPTNGQIPGQIPQNLFNNGQLSNGQIPINQFQPFPSSQNQLPINSQFPTNQFPNNQFSPGMNGHLQPNNQLLPGQGNGNFQTQPFSNNVVPNG